jgi:hypothetical protein
VQRALLYRQRIQAFDVSDVIHDDTDSLRSVRNNSRSEPKELTESNGTEQREEFIPIKPDLNVILRTEKRTIPRVIEKTIK